MTVSTHPAKHWQQLPTELILLIIDLIPIGHILPLRTISRSIKSHIDTHVLYSYLRRTELKGLVTTTDAGGPLKLLELHDTKHLVSITALFSHLEDGLHVENPIAGNTSQRKAGWAGTHAVFRLDPHWLTTYNRVRHTISPPFSQSPYHLLKGLRTLFPSYLTDRVTWSIQVDHAVHELDLGGHERGTWRHRLRADLDSWTVKVEWRSMLWMFLKRESDFTRRLHHTKACDMPQGRGDGQPRSRDIHPRYSHEERCIRAVSRQCQLRSLDSEHSYEGDMAQSLSGLDLLIPLQGQSPAYGPPHFRAALVP